MVLQTVKVQTIRCLEEDSIWTGIFNLIFFLKNEHFRNFLSQQQWKNNNNNNNFDNRLIIVEAMEVKLTCEKNLSLRQKDYRKDF